MPENMCGFGAKPLKRVIKSVFRYTVLCVLIWATLFAPVAASEKQTDPGLIAFAGTVLDKQTGTSLDNATIVFLQTEARLTSDRSGKFQIDLPDGEYTLIITRPGFEKLRQTISIGPDKPSSMTFTMVPLSDQVTILDDMTVTDTQTKTDVQISAQRLSLEEVSHIPGTNRDIIKGITNLPGVNTVSVFNGYGSGLIIRGSAPEDSVYHIDDHWVPMLYHFGGFESIFEPELVDSIDYYAGGFSPEYLEALGGVVQVNVRDPRSDRIGGYLNLSLLSSSFMVEGPVGDKGSAAISVKRGFLDVYTRMLASEFEDELSFTTYPVYYDGSFIYTYHLSDHSKLKVITIGAYDRTKLVLENETESARFSDNISEGQQFVHCITEWHYHNGNFKSVFSPMAGNSKFMLDFGPRAYFNLTTNVISFSEKATLQVNPIHQVQFGGRLVYFNVNMDSSFFAPPKEGEVAYDPFAEEINDDQDINLVLPAFYAMDVIKFGKYIITPGFHFLYDTHNKHHYLDPRLLVRYNLNQKWTLKSAIGQYSKMPEEDESYAPWGTQGLRPERSYHLVAGFEHYLTDTMLFDVQGFYKKFMDLVVRVDENDPTHYGNEGTGFAYGMEVLLRQEMTEKWFGWLAYSYTVSKRKDGPDKEERYFDMDITHNLAAVISYKPSDFWQFGARFNYASGPPYTDLLNTQTIYDADNGYYTPIYNGPINNERVKDRHQLDIRVDRYWYFDKFVMSTYIDVQNVYMHKQAIGVVYNEDYTEKDNFKSLPILVFFGLKFDY